MIFWDVVAVPVTFPVNVPKKFVAVNAVPVWFPEKTSAVSTLVDGLYCNPASEDNAIPVPVAFNENTTEWFELLAPAAKLIFCAVVAAPVTFPVRVPKKLVDVTAVALTFPLNTSAVRTLVPGLNCNWASDETATPEAVAFTGENNK